MLPTLRAYSSRCAGGIPRKKSRKLMLLTLPHGKRFAQDPRVNGSLDTDGMKVYEVRRERLAELLRQIPAAELARLSGIAASTITRYGYEPGRKGAKNMTEENARKLEHAAKKPTYWLDRQHSTAGPAAGGMAHRMSDFGPEDAPHVEWRDIMLRTELPRLFWVALPDDSMAPRAPAGRLICFDTGLPPRPGDGVLVSDRDGAIYFRIYRVAAGGHWTAHAINSQAFHDLDSERDGLRVLAVLKAEEGRWS